MSSLRFCSYINCPLILKCAFFRKTYCYVQYSWKILLLKYTLWKNAVALFHNRDPWNFVLHSRHTAPFLDYKASISTIESQKYRPELPRIEYNGKNKESKYPVINLWIKVPFSSEPNFSVHMTIFFFNTLCFLVRCVTRSFLHSSRPEKNPFGFFSAHRLHYFA